jgi:hypothetical protein
MKFNDFLKIGGAIFAIFFLGDYGIQYGPLSLVQILGGFALFYTLYTIFSRNEKEDSDTPKDNNTTFNRTGLNLKLIQTPIIFIFVGLYFAYNSPLPAKIYYGFPLNKIIGFGIIGIQVLSIIRYLTQSKK